MPNSANSFPSKTVISHGKMAPWLCVQRKIFLTEARSSLLGVTLSGRTVAFRVVGISKPHESSPVGCTSLRPCAASTAEGATIRKGSHTPDFILEIISTLLPCANGSPPGWYTRHTVVSCHVPSLILVVMQMASSVMNEK